MGDGLGEVCGGLLALAIFPLIMWVVASVASEQNKRETGNQWLDAPGDDRNTGWTNFDYIAANELEDMWSDD